MVYIYNTPSSQCDHYQMVLKSLTIESTQIFNSQVDVVAGGGAKEVRFLFFLPLPTGPLLGSGDIVGTFGTGPWEVGAGVGEDRIVVAAEVSATVTKLSVVCTNEDEKDILEWAAVVRMAFINSQLFFCLFGASLRLSFGTSEVVSLSVRLNSSTACLLVGYSMDGSVMGQTKPVRGV